VLILFLLFILAENDSSEIKDDYKCLKEEKQKNDRNETEEDRVKFEPKKFGLKAVKNYSKKELLFCSCVSWFYVWCTKYETFPFFLTDAVKGIFHTFINYYVYDESVKAKFN